MSFHLTALPGRRQRCCAHFGAAHWTNGQQALVEFNTSCVVLAFPQSGHSSRALHCYQHSTFHGTFNSQMGTAFISNHTGQQIKPIREDSLWQARMLWRYTFHSPEMPVTKSSWCFHWTGTSRCKDDKYLIFIQIIHYTFRGLSRRSTCLKS